MVGYVLPFCQKLDWWNRYHPIHHLKILKSTEKTPLYASMVVELCPYWAYWHDDDAMRTGPRTNGIRPQEVSQLRRCGLELGNSSCVRNNLGPLKLQLCQSMTVWLWPMWYYSPKDSAYMCIYVHICAYLYSCIDVFVSDFTYFDHIQITAPTIVHPICVEIHKYRICQRQDLLTSTAKSCPEQNSCTKSLRTR
jgi:hypothetical protein